ncbi:methyltransferase domain-containing protein [Streptomyces sp. SBT349]|uniref:methyltransferase domain-containing protein n=1 Tax=Streptomyces sp. SBT349 TaxID=1580539 RepID=UPI00069EF472|nr:methyltransferase domain-containing protein [Streptomyces sp. SBT349]
MKASAPGPAAVGGGVVAAGWDAAFDALPRSLFLPELVWAFEAEGHAVAVDRVEEPLVWREAAESDQPVITQWDNGRHRGRAPGRTPTSSASAPPLVAAMLAALDVAPGMRVLEVGTGTGWNAGLLAHRLGQENVTTVEVDERVARAARRSLEGVGLHPRVVTGDGALGVPDAAPYDRIIATCGMRRIPAAWLAQLRPGGVVLATWGTAFSSTDALVRAHRPRGRHGHRAVPVAGGVHEVTRRRRRERRGEAAPLPAGPPDRRHHQHGLATGRHLAPVPVRRGTVDAGGRTRGPGP